MKDIESIVRRIETRQALIIDAAAIVDYSDSYIPEIPKLRKYNLRMKSIPLSRRTIDSYDAVLIATDHSYYDYKEIYSGAKLIIDARNALKVSITDKKVVKA